MKSKKPPNFSDQCAAFISSDIKTAFQEGLEKNDIVAGLVYSICINYINRVKGARQTGKKVFMQGGVCYNKAVPVAMAALTGRQIIVPPEPGLMGAFGVALEIKNMINAGFLEKKDFNLQELFEREVGYGDSFKCQGLAENCDRKCDISMILVMGKKIPFGGACNKYYNIAHKIKHDIDHLNHVEKRRELLYERFTLKNHNLKEDAIIVGINRSFQTNTLYPFYYNFFNELGCKVVLSDSPVEGASDKGLTSYCLSGQIALGMFADLLEKKPDYIFMPQIMEMNVSKQEEYRKEFQTVCMFVQGEAFYQRATFLKDRKNPPKMLMPALNFMSGFDSQESVFISVAKEMGFSSEEGKKAHAIAYQKQSEFFLALKEEGRKILKSLESDPSKVAIVLFGRPYNAFASETNKGVPFKFASRGIEIIPYDFLPYEDEDNYKGTYWEMGQRIIKAARIVKRHPQLFGCYLTNFLCALDSMMVPHFRDLMNTKPSLTIEVDGHTADAGVNTRIEAFMDVVRNYLKMSDRIKDIESTFIRAETKLDTSGNVAFIDSSGISFSFKDHRVKVIVPSMGDLFNRGAAAAFRAQGWNAEALPVCDREALDLGRSVTTSKECLPIINIIGEVLKYLKYRKNPDEKLAVFLVSAGGCCRVGQYEILMKTTIDKLKLKDVAVITLANDNGYAGLGVSFRIDALKILYASDIMDDIRSAIKALAVDKQNASTIFQEEYNKILGSIDRTNKVPFYKQIKLTVDRLKTIKLETPIEDAKYIGVVGEIFVRRDHFSLMGIPDKLAEKKFVMLDAHITEWVRYVDFLVSIKMFETRSTLLGKIESIVSNMIHKYHEKRQKRLFSKTGLYEYETLKIKEYLDHSTHIFPLTLTGEPGLSTGASMYHLIDKYCGVINVGPFGCMNSRMTEAVTTADMTVSGKEEAIKNAGRTASYENVKNDIDILPFLSVECDGNPFSQILEARLETFMLQANRLHESMRKNKNI